MGTNYFYEYNICTCCNRRDNLHIGKKSAGWRFGFRGFKRDPWDDGDEGIVPESWQEWNHFMGIHPGRIVNQYGDTMELDTFIEMINMTHDTLRDGTLRPMLVNGGHEHSWNDPEGYGFTGVEFS